MPSVVEHIRSTLDTIEIVEDEDDLNAFITVDREGAMAAARAADDRRVAGRRLGPLDGEPIAVKDNLDTAGLRTTLGLGLHRDRVPSTDAAVVARLRAAGAVIVGKTNMTELACGTVGGNEHYGDPRHPHGADRYPGGSSSGSAVAVGTGLVYDAIGTDTGGSIRHPAAVCGVVGLKPTFGRTSNEGVSVCARTMDHVGPISVSAAHAADVLAAIQEPGFDDPSRLLATPIHGARVGVLTGAFLESCTAEVVAAFDPALDLLDSLGATVRELDLGLDLRSVDDEVANVLGADLFDEYGDLLMDAGPDALGSELKEWFARYEQVDARARATAVDRQRSLTREVDTALAPFDVVVCPTTRTATTSYADGQAADRFDRVGNLALWNVTGHPSITIPFGEAHDGSPLGLLLTGQRGADARVLQLADAIEQAGRFAPRRGWGPRRSATGRVDRDATRAH